MEFEDSRTPEPCPIMIGADERQQQLLWNELDGNRWRKQTKLWNGYGDRVVLENAEAVANLACLDVGESLAGNPTKPDTFERSKETQT